MGEINDNQHEVIDRLRPDRCPDCGYSLTGLPASGVCPECGLAYSNLVVIYGPKGGLLSATDPGWLARMRRLAMRLWMIPVWLLVVFVWVRLAELHPMLKRRPVGFYGIILILLGLFLYRLWRRWRDGVPHRWQLRLSPRGFAQREFLGPVPLHPWTPELRVRVRIDRYAPLGHAGLYWPAYQRWVAVSITRPGPSANCHETLADVAFACEVDAAARLHDMVHEWHRMSAARSGDLPGQRPRASTIVNIIGDSHQ